MHVGVFGNQVRIKQMVPPLRETQPGSPSCSNRRCYTPQPGRTPRRPSQRKPMFLVSVLSALLSTAGASPAIQFNDNLATAGRLEAGVLAVRLVADMGTWRPNGPEGAPLTIAAFGEDGSALSVPGPLIRGVEGTTVALSLRNALGSDLRVSGLCAGAAPCAPVTVAAGESREIRFSLTRPGTFYYWASSSARPMAARPRIESQLGGVIVVDPRGGAAPDRILVISALADPQPVGPCGADPGPGVVFAINGASWP